MASPGISEAWRDFDCDLCWTPIDVGDYLGYIDGEIVCSWCWEEFR